MSIRLRLTLLYSVILALTLVGFSVASYVTVARDGFNRQVATLASKAERIVSDPQFQVADMTTLAHQYAGPDIFVQTRDEVGSVVDRSPNLGATDLPFNATPSIEGAWDDIVMIDGERWVVYNRPISPNLLQIASSLTDRDRSLSNLARMLVAANVVVSIAAFCSGWIVAGIGLRPIFRLAQAVLTIGRTRNFSQRINYVGSEDEIGQLATTFDQMMSQLEAAHRQTEQALQTQKRFVADASHELRTPLTTVRGNLDLLRREPPISDPDRLAVLADLVGETDRLIRLVNDLLVLARADAHPTVWQEPTPLQPLLASVERQIKQLASQRTIHFSPTPPVCFLGNADALKQLLLILLDNAVKHTPPSAHISVQSDATDSQVDICVCDTGTGIAQAHLAAIFDRFYVVDSARTNSTGLGLSIAKTLVERQQGEITVASSPATGTTFKVTLACFIES